MADDGIVASRTKAWLVSRSGPLAGTRYLLPDGCTRIGRSPENEVVIQGPSAATVSAQHVEISKDGDHWRIRDTGSTNGTYLNGEKIADAELCAQAIIQLGNDGPEFAFLMEESAPSELERTLVIPRGIVPTQLRAAQAAHPESHEALLSEAVKRARLARIQGLGGQTHDPDARRGSPGPGAQQPALHGCHLRARGHPPADFGVRLLEDPCTEGGEGID